MHRSLGLVTVGRNVLRMREGFYVEERSAGTAAQLLESQRF
jgi:hypothetical protein